MKTRFALILVWLFTALACFGQVNLIVAPSGTLTVRTNLAVPLGQIGLVDVTLTSSSATPEGAVTANPGSMHFRRDTGDWYRKASGTGNTGWAIQAASVSDNWVASGTTNSVLSGTGLLYNLVATNDITLGAKLIFSPGETNLLYRLDTDLVYSNSISSSAGPYIQIWDGLGNAGLVGVSGNIVQLKTAGSAVGVELMDDSSRSVRWFANGLVPTQSNSSVGSSANPWQDIYLSRNIVWNGTTNTVWDFAGTGSPEGVVVAGVGSIYRRYDGGAATSVYIKETGVGNTGWVAIGAPGSYITALTGDVTASGPGSVAATIAANSVALTTDTTGNYVVDVLGTANEITLTHTPAEGSTATVSLPTAIDLGGKTSFEIPNAAAPTVDAFGELAGDNDLWAASRGAPVFFDGTAAVGLIGALVTDVPGNGQVPKWNTGGTITWEDDAGAGAGAPTTSQYLTLAADAGLSAERILTGTADQIILTDSGADAALTLSTPQSIATTSTPQFSKVGLNVAADANNKLKVNSPVIADTLAEVLIAASAATQKPLVVQGAASQTAALFTTQSSAGTVGMSISSAGTVRYGAGANSYSSESEWRIISSGHLNWNADTYLYRDGAAAKLQLGLDSATALENELSGPEGVGTDKVGGSIVIAGGQSTGSGTPGDFATQTSLTGATGSAVNAFQKRELIRGKEVTLTESTATLVVNIALASSKYVGIRILATTHADDATDFQAVSEVLTIAAVNKAGTVTATVSASSPTATIQSSGTLTTAWTAVANSNSIDIKCNAVSSLTQTTLRTKYRIDVDSDDTAVITP